MRFLWNATRKLKNSPCTAAHSRSTGPPEIVNIFWRPPEAEAEAGAEAACIEILLLLPTIPFSVMSGRVWCALLAFLAVPAYAQNSTAPTVTLNGAGSVVGVTNLTTKLDTFLGIPYALAPLGPLRFAAPVALPDEPSRVIQAVDYGPACLQPPSVSPPSVSASAPT
jgi:hypothetical protein